MDWSSSDIILKEDQLRTIAVVNGSKWPLGFRRKKLKRKDYDDVKHVQRTDDGRI